MVQEKGSLILSLKKWNSYIELFIPDENVHGPDLQQNNLTTKIIQ